MCNSSHSLSWTIFHRFCLYACMAALLACASTSQGPDIGRLPIITSANPKAEADLRQARVARDSKKTDTAKARYRQFLRDHPDDPLVPIAELELGRLLLDSDDNDVAAALFQDVARHRDPAVAEQGRFYGAVAAVRKAPDREAAATLRGMVGRTTNPEDTMLLHMSLAEADLALDNYAGAVLALSGLLEHAELSAEDRERAKERLAAVLSREGSAEQVREALNALTPESPAYQETLRRAISDADAAHNATRLNDLLARYKEAGLPMDDALRALSLRAAEPQKANPRAIGAILSLSGRARQVGEVALRGLMLAANLPPSGPVSPDAPQLIVRDDGGDSQRAVEAVDELVNVHRVVAIVGPMDRTTTLAAASRAQELGVPLVALTPASGVVAVGPRIFQALATAASEVTALVRFAKAQQLSRVAILHPDSSYGSTLASLFSQALYAETGVQPVAVQSYPADATAFGHEIAELSKHQFDALFLPDASPRIALLAPALAAAGLWSTPLGKKPPGKGRAVQLLIPSVGFSGDLAQKSGRYLQGAAFTTPFAENSSDPSAQAFADRYQAEYGSPPNTLAAVAYDAYKLIASASAQGDATRDQVAHKLVGGRSADTVALIHGLGENRRPAEPLRIQVLEDVSMVDAPSAR